MGLRLFMVERCWLCKGGFLLPQERASESIDRKRIYAQT